MYVCIMLFKTIDPNLAVGYFYCELPKKFRCETLQRKATFQSCYSVCLGDVFAKRPDEPKIPEEMEFNQEVPNNCYIKEGVNHLYFEQDGEEQHIFFIANAWIIDKKNQTVETL